MGDDMTDYWLGPKDAGWEPGSIVRARGRLREGGGGGDRGPHGEAMASDDGGPCLRFCDWVRSDVISSGVVEVAGAGG